ncbi:unnamed protein product [Rhizophagus irregularis]|nr:unnamed protein product [Rhizophagus irregularis]
MSSGVNPSLSNWILNDIQMYSPKSDSFITKSQWRIAKAPNGSGLNREPIRNQQKIRFGSRFSFGLETVRFSSVLSEIKKKCEKTNMRLSSNRTRTSHNSLESSHRDASNGGKIKSLASIHHEIAHGECFLKNLH